jgi:triosephosphate isomerase
MYKTPAEAGTFARNLLEKIPEDHAVEVVVCPPFPAIPAVATKLTGSRIGWGAQNMHWEAEGAYTGEVSAPMLQALGCRYVILGHSERRVQFEETGEQIRKKMKAALSFGLRPIYCLGEDSATRDAGDAEFFCLHQLADGLEGLPWADPQNLVVAYEPIWCRRTVIMSPAINVGLNHSFVLDMLLTPEESGSFRAGSITTGSGALCYDKQGSDVACPRSTLRVYTWITCRNGS